MLAWSGGIARIVPEWAESRCRLVHDEKGGRDVRWLQHRKLRENLEEPVSPGVLRVLSVENRSVKALRADK